MRRISVTAIIREAYDFTIINLGAIIGLIWMPMVLMTVGQFFVNQHYGAQINEAVAAGNPAAAGPAVLAMLFFLLIQLALTAMMMVSVTQLALGQRQGGAMFHFTFGALEWRMFRTLFAAALFLLPPLMLLLLSGGAVMGGAPAGGPQGMGALLALPLLAGVLYFAVRLMALLFPVVLTEEKSIIVRAWTLTTGNFWRLLGAFLGALLPVYILTMVAMVFVLRDALPAGSSGGMPTQEELAALAAVRDANLPILTGIQFAVAPLLVGLVVGVSAFSFKALTKTDISA